MFVHGGIRHLEIEISGRDLVGQVHGGIRHLEMANRLVNLNLLVHGGIRHLERKYSLGWMDGISSWRHTPFRKVQA